MAIKQHFYWCLFKLLLAKRDINRTSRFFHTPLHSTPPLGRSPSECCHNVWYWKTGTVGPPDVKTLRICSAASTEYLCVTDGQSDGRTDTLRQPFMRYSVSKNGVTLKTRFGVVQGHWISWKCLMLVKLEWLSYRTVKKLWRYVKPFSSSTGT